MLSHIRNTGYLGEHIEQVTCFLMPPAYRILWLQPKAESVQSSIKAFSIEELLPAPAGKSHMPPLLQGEVSRAK